MQTCKIAVPRYTEHKHHQPTLWAECGAPATFMMRKNGLTPVCDHHKNDLNYSEWTLHGSILTPVFFEISKDEQ